MKKANDFGRDSIPLLVLKISIPFMIAQFVYILTRKNRLHGRSEPL